MNHVFPIIPLPWGELLEMAFLWVAFPLMGAFYAAAAFPLTRQRSLRFLEALSRATSSRYWYLLVMGVMVTAFMVSAHNASFALECVLAFSVVFRLPPALIRWIFTDTVPPAHLRRERRSGRNPLRA